MESFSQNVIAQLKHYVYILVDPRTNEIFYVGKGSSDRVFDHEKNIDNSEKGKRLQEIHENGLEAKKYIVHAGLTEKEAFAVETAIYNICNSSNLFHSVDLTNELVPHNVLMPCSEVEDIEKSLSSVSLEKKDFSQEDRIMLVNIKTSSIAACISDEVYHEYIRKMATVYKESDKPLHILSVVRGMVVGAYAVQGWEEEKFEKKFSKTVTECTKYTPKEIVRDLDMQEKYKWSNVEHILAKTSKAYKVRTY